MFSEETLVSSRRLAAEWERNYQKMVDRFGENAPTRARAPETHSGLPIKNAYFPHDIEDLDLGVMGAPGSYPFTRGNLAAQHQLMSWANQPVIGYGLPEHTRARMDFLESQGMAGYFGQTFYNLVYDLVSHEGLDPDHPGARGRSGQCGMAVYNVRDMDRLFKGLDLRRINAIHITYYQVIPALAQYIVLGEQRGLRPDELRGNSMNWYHQAAYVGMSAFPADQGLKLSAELISYCSKHMPRWNTTNIVGYCLEEAGGTAVQEIGVMLAVGRDLARACIAAGVKPDDFLPRIGFQFAQANDFFEEIAKIRAMRRIWATTMHEEFGARDPKSMNVRIHTHTSGAVLTAQQPLVNLIRTSIHALGAALSGTQAMEVSAYDEALAIPSEEAATLSLRVQQVIEEETNVCAVSDPLAGSYYVESLTDRVAKAAMKVADEIEQMGGFVEAQKAGWIRAEVERSSERWREMVNSGERRIVGLNCHVVEEPEQPEIFKVDPEVQRIAIERIQELRETRDQTRHAAAMERFEEEVARFAKAELQDLGNDRLMEAAIDAARAEASTGEMMAVMKAHLGWGAPHEF
ncbi:acyl-CoA mutase large subunit family protein [Microtetraspora sp. NBRC 16547]|uniref:acyl-CoA mutase large subunit family protein n=1 Tax=Microtetraspora sp. NBRC 16547 TaxID=3030993 RepID=UPI0024A0A020|nr:acyl-CoA mutase large subunit family protein [Microtetraspora sp. NBRC 16547]GLW99309.1 methylmalonyl-CoA mutase [Microtetraspora sp. NBRC 16547]